MHIHAQAHMILACFLKGHCLFFSLRCQEVRRIDNKLAVSNILRR